MSTNKDYKPGNPEYDYWNDKNLYPSLRHDDNYSQPQSHNSLNSTKTSLSSVFFIMFIWLLILAPLALFLTWENWLTQVIFWSGIITTTLAFISWLHDAIKECKKP